MSSWGSPSNCDSGIGCRSIKFYLTIYFEFMKSASNWLQNPLDFAEIDYLDPALKEGHRVLYDRVMHINIRFQDRFSEVQELSQPEPIRIRVL